MPMKNAIKEIYTQRENFIIIGLTGRSGSGCSTSAELLERSFDQLSISEDNFLNKMDNSGRKIRIINKFAKKHWHPFFKIQVRDVITTFILECTFDEIDSYFQQISIPNGINEIKEEYEEYYNKNKCLDNVILREYDKANADEVYNYLKNDLPIFTEKLKNHIDNKSSISFIKIYQKIGDNIRKNGIALPKEDINVEHIYAIAQRINVIIKILRKYNKSKMIKDYFVIDTFRNPFEVFFFKERYSAFYLISINAPNEDRIDRLSKKYDFPLSTIEEIDEKEYSMADPLTDISSFVSQNISSCIQHADIHVNNNGKFGNQNFNHLKNQLITFVSLIQHPGLITPSRHEKLMQIAFTAKLNSGCLSRQVGAVVTNEYRTIKAIGWNSSPDDQVPCTLRNLNDLISNVDDTAYSYYEKTDIEFRNVAEKYFDKYPNIDELDGRSIYYCFKDLQNVKEGKKNQVHNRSLHAEENAFLQLAKYGSEGIKSGVLYTTASPCDACSRKAYQLGISQIVYIDPYPGIAIDHVLKCGNQIPELILFSGAIGRAYHQLYTPILPIKDELRAFMNI
ncbi:MAG: hypothetical protein AB7S75_00980 [Desulfococcaceae bacterium]